MPKYPINMLNPNLYRQFSTSPMEELNFMMSNFSDNYYTKLTSDNKIGSFMAIVLSGLRTEDNTGASLDELDSKLVNGRLELVIMPLDQPFANCGDPRNAKNKEEAIEIIKRNSEVFTAKSEFKVTVGRPLHFGQKVKCRYIKGSLGRASQRDLVFEMPVFYDPDKSFDSVKKMGFSQRAITKFSSGNIGLLGEMSNLGLSYATLPWQISNATFPLDPAKSRITSLMGPRQTGIDGASVNHSGVDIGAPLGTPLYAMFDGEVLTARESGRPYIPDPVYGQVGSSGYGLVVVIRYKARRNNGEIVTFTSEYGHLQDMMVRKNDKVTKGQQVATVGSRGTSGGAHLHINIRLGPKSMSGTLQDALALFNFHEAYAFKHTHHKNKWYAKHPEFLQ